MSGEQAVTVLTIAGALGFGMALALLGSLKLALARRPEHASRPINVLLVLLNATLIPLVLLNGLLVDSWGVRPMLIAGPVVLALSFLALSAGPAYIRTVVAVLFAALGAAALGIATLVLMPRGLFGPSESAASLQLGLVFVALGALITPPLVDLLLRGLGFRTTMALFALVFLLPAFLAALPDPAALPRGESMAGLAALGGLVRDVGVWMACLVFFFYAPLEAFVGVWTVTYLASAGQSRRQMLWLSCFWAAFVLSRLLFALVLHAGYLGDTYDGWFLVLPALLCAVVLGNLSGTTRYSAALPWLLTLGFFMGPIFPVLTGMLFRMTPHIGLAPGTGYALLHTCGSLGSLALAPLVNLSLNARTLQASLRIPVFIALVLSATALVFVLVAP